MKFRLYKREMGLIKEGIQCPEKGIYHEMRSPNSGKFGKGRAHFMGYGLLLTTKFGKIIIFEQSTGSVVFAFPIFSYLKTPKSLV